MWEESGKEIHSLRLIKFLLENCYYTGPIGSEHNDVPIFRESNFTEILLANLIIWLIV